MDEQRKLGNDIIAIILLALIVFVVAAIASFDRGDSMLVANSVLSQIYQPDQLVYPGNTEIQNCCGSFGAWLADLLLNVLGTGTFFLIIGLVSLEIKLFQQRSVESPWFRTAGWIISLLGMTTLSTMLLPTIISYPIIGSGGYVGEILFNLLQRNIGTAGAFIVAISCSLIGLMMWTEYLVFRAGRIAFAPAAVAAASLLPFGIIHGLMQRFNGRHTQRSRSTTDLDDEFEAEDEGDEDVSEFVQRRRRRSTIKIKSGSTSDDADIDDVADEATGSDVVETEAEDDETESIDNHFDAIDDEADEVEAASISQKPHFMIKKGKSKKKEPAASAPKSERDEVMDQLDQAALADTMDDYELPSMELLLEGDTVPFEDQKRDALKKAKILENTCEEFGYKVNVVEVETGPVISQYEIQLEPGLRLQKITALADDLAIALRVPSVRIVAPIPGKNTVGVEVPNENRQVVRLREVMEQCEQKTSRMNIPLFLGNDAVGAPMLIDLAKMPHLLIAGRTGTGKSVCLNAIISSILMTRRPDEVRMLMIDPKMVELSGYGRLPHLMHPVVTDMRKAEAILAWAVEKMEDRYRLLARAGVRHINSYNQLGEEELIDRLQPQNEEERREIPSNLPFIVIVADEMADLMMTAGKEVEQHIIRLAQKSRAVGIHLILATQKPTVDVITGLIKSNLPARLAFQVASKMDSRVVLDAMGAEKLLGSGDMLFLWPGTSTLIRGQGTFLSDDEIDSITEAVSTGEQNFVHELVNMKIEESADDSSDAGEFKKRDELYSQAVDVVVNEQRGSVSLLQRSLGIGYGRAARLIDFMEEDGYVGPYNGSKSREVLLTPEKWSAMHDDDDEMQSEAVDDEDVGLQKIEPLRQQKLAANETIKISEFEENQDTSFDESGVLESEFDEEPDNHFVDDTKFEMADDDADDFSFEADENEFDEEVEDEEDEEEEEFEDDELDEDLEEDEFIEDEIDEDETA